MNAMIVMNVLTMPRAKTQKEATHAAAMMVSLGMEERVQVCKKLCAVLYIKATNQPLFTRMESQKQAS